MKRLFTAAVCALALTACASATAQQGAPAQAAEQAPMTSTVPIPGVLMVRVYSSDIARTQRFYSELFGMRATPQNPTEVSMAFTAPGSSVGVIINQQRDGHEMRSGFIARVADVADTVSRTEAAGGRVLRPAMTVPQMHLSVGVIADPDGTEIELIQLPPSN